MSVSERLKKLIDGSEYTFEQLGELTGIAKSSLQRYASGTTKKIPIDVIELVAPHLGVSAAHIMGWEDDAATPNLPADTPLTPAGHRVGSAYEKAPQREQGIVEQVLEPYFDSTDNVIYSRFRISEQPCAAGLGVYLGPETFIEYDVDESKLPRGAAFGVPISGDSMEPLYRDGDIAIISKEPPKIGQVGLFTLRGDGYIKKCGDGVLLSINPNYEDIPMAEGIIPNGRVVGTITWDDVRK